MKNLLLLSLTFTLFSSIGYTAELNYKWAIGSTYRFSAEVTDDVTTSMMGMNIHDQFKTSTDFVLYIARVDASGTASGMLYLTNFKVSNSAGQTLATLSDIPAKAIQSEVKVDKKGKFTFLQKVYLITSAKGNILASAKVDANGTSSSASVSASASASDGAGSATIKVEAYASFDAKTGTLKTGYKVDATTHPTTVEVEVTQETDQIDVLPYDFLELLALPEGDVALNDKASVTAGMYKMDVVVTSMTGGIATVNTQMATDKSADMFDGAASGQKGDGSGSFDMNMDTNLEEGSTETSMDMDMGSTMNMEMGMDGMGGLDMQDQMAIAGSKSMAPDMTCNINNQFNYTKGMFENVSGTCSTNMNTMGMKMTVHSTLKMVLVK